MHIVLFDFCVLCCASVDRGSYIWMLSIPTRAINPHSHAVRRIINMSGGGSSSSVKRKRDNPGDTRPDIKAPKRASEPRHILKQHASLPVGGGEVFRLLTHSLFAPSLSNL